MNLNLKSNGAIAKFLGFCTYQPTYNPASFCSLVWMLGFSPLVFLGCSINAGVVGLSNKYETAIDNNRKRQARALVQIYLADPKEALLDFKEHFVPHHSGVKDFRDWRVVDEAFTMLAEQFGDKDMRYFLILAKLGAVPDDTNVGWDFMESHDYRVQTKQQTVSVKRSVKRFIMDYGKALFVATVAFICSLFPAIVVPELVLTVGPTVLIIGLLVTMFYRLEFNVVVYNLYRAVKTKTCPIIKWEE